MSRPPGVLAPGTVEYGPHDPYCVAALLGARPGLPCVGGEVQMLPRAAAQAKPRRSTTPTPTPAIQEALGVVPWIFLPDRPWPGAVAYRLIGLRLYAGDEVEPDRPHAVWTWSPEEMGERVSEERRVELNVETKRRAEAMLARIPQMLPGSPDAAAVRLHRLADDPLGDLGFWVTPRGLLRARDDEAPKAVRPRPDKDYRAMSLVVDLRAVKIPGLPGGRASVGFSRALANLASSLCGSVSVVEVMAGPASMTTTGGAAFTPAEVRAEVLRLHAEGLMNSAIVLRVGRSPSRVHQILMDVKVPANRKVKPADDVVVALYEEGYTDGDIARQFEVSIDTVRFIRKRAGVQGQRGGTPKLGPADVERLLSLARQGWRQDDIAAELGVGQATVSQIMRRNGIERQPGRPRQVKS